MVAAGQRVRAVDFTQAVTDTQSTSGTTTSTSFTETLTNGTACGVVFVAPTSGSVMVVNSAQMDNDSSGGFTFLGFIVRTGSTIGSGSTVLDADFARSLMVVGTADIQASRSVVVTGLTPGATYNVRQAFRVSAGTGTYLRKDLTVFPLP